MNTVTKLCSQMAILLLCISCTKTAMAQDVVSAKNFVGIHAGAGWTTTSVFAGFSYERLWKTGNKLELGAKGSYTMPYKYGNLILFFGPHYNYRVSETNFSVTGYRYLHPEKINTGFFLSLEGGMSVTTWQRPNESELWTNPLIGAGFGWKWALSNKFSLRLTNAFTVKKAPINGPSAVNTMSTLAFGF